MKHLTGIPASGAGSIQYAIKKGDPIDVFDVGLTAVGETEIVPDDHHPRADVPAQQFNELRAAQLAQTRSELQNETAVHARTLQQHELLAKLRQPRRRMLAPSAVGCKPMLGAELCDGVWQRGVIDSERCAHLLPR